MDGVRFTTRSRGIGDIGLCALYSLYRDDHHRVIALAGISFPTGSVDENDRLPATMMTPSSIQRLPYPMQLFRGLVVGLEAGLPVYQSLDGPQLETDWITRLSIQWTL